MVSRDVCGCNRDRGCSQRAGVKMEFGLRQSTTEELEGQLEQAAEEARHCGYKGLLLTVLWSRGGRFANEAGSRVSILWAARQELDEAK